MTVSNLRRYAYLLRTFRNGVQLIRAYRSGSPCGLAVTWGGRRIVHPANRGGLVGTLLEVWYEDCYLGDFYQPRPGDVVIDAGGHVGSFSLRVALRQPACRVITLEPFGENHACLLRNLTEFGARNVTPHQMALGGHAGLGRVRAVTNRSIDHLLEDAADGAPDAVPVVTLDGLFGLAGADRIAMLKCDVEGAEHDAFESASPEALERIDRIALEYHDHLRPGTLQLLKDRLAPTHHLRIVPTFERGYGVLYAVRK